MSSDACASPPQTQDAQAMQKIEKRRQQFRELQELRFNQRLERMQDAQSGAVRDRGALPPIRESSSGAIDRDERSAERPIIKLNRLSPEERLALRRQIREARQDIYLRRLQKQKN